MKSHWSDERRRNIGANNPRYAAAPGWSGFHSPERQSWRPTSSASRQLVCHANWFPAVAKAVSNPQRTGNPNRTASQDMIQATHTLAALTRASR